MGRGLWHPWGGRRGRGRGPGWEAGPPCGAGGGARRRGLSALPGAGSSHRVARSTPPHPLDSGAGLPSQLLEAFPGHARGLWSAGICWDLRAQLPPDACFPLPGTGRLRWGCRGRGAGTPPTRVACSSRWTRPGGQGTVRPPGPARAFPRRGLASAGQQHRRRQRPRSPTRTPSSADDSGNGGSSLQGP